MRYQPYKWIPIDVRAQNAMRNPKEGALLHTTTSRGGGAGERRVSSLVAVSLDLHILLSSMGGACSSCLGKRQEHASQDVSVCIDVQ